MKKLILALLVVSLFSCNQESNEKNTEKNQEVNSNALLYNKVTVKQRFNLRDTESIINSDLIKKIRDASIEGKPVYDFYGKFKMSKQEVVSNMLYSVDTILIEKENTKETEEKVIKTEYTLNQFNKLFFVEDWYLDNEMKIFEKELVKYSLLKEVIDHQAVIDGLNKKDTVDYITITIVNNDSADNYSLIAQNVRSKFLFEQQDQSFLRGFDVEKFSNMMLDYVFVDNKDVYSFEDLELKLPIDEVKQMVGYETDSVIVEDINTDDITTVIDYNKPDVQNILGVVFIEDWYYDENTMLIKKKVLGIAPLWYSAVMSTSGEYYEMELTPFVIKFKD